MKEKVKYVSERLSLVAVSLASTGKKEQSSGEKRILCRSGKKLQPFQPFPKDQYQGNVPTGLQR